MRFTGGLTVLLVLTLGLASAPALAETPAPAAPRVEALTLEAALRAAEAGNVSYLRAQLAVTQAELALARLAADREVKAQALALQQAEGAKATAEVAREAARRRLRLDVQRAYHTLLSARKQQQVAREALAQAQEQSRVIQGRRKSGAATALDLLSAEKALSEATAGQVRSEAAEHSAELALGDLLGRPSGMRFSLAEPAAERRPKPSEEAAVPLALERSSEVRQAREAVEAARVGVDLATNDYTPALARQSAEARLADARLALEESVRRVSLAVRRTYADLKVAEGALAAAEKAVAAASEGYRAAKVRFDVGTAVIDEFLAAQVRLFQTRQAELQAQLDLDLARTVLFSLIGE